MESNKKIQISVEEYEQFLSQKTQIAYLESQLSDLQRMIFGSQSERHIHPVDSHQTSLFDDLKKEGQEADQEEEQVSYSRKKAKKDKKHPLRTDLPAHLPRKEEILQPEGIPEGLKPIGEEISERLEYTPASLFVKRTIRPKYILHTNDEATRIAIAPMPKQPFPKANAAASLVSYLIISKYVDHLPFYRLAKMFQRQDKIKLPESTIGGWFRAASQMLQPLYEILKTQLLTSTYLQADETPISVLTKDKPGATHKGYHWVYHDPVTKTVMFDYRKTRSREGPDDILANFKGFLQTDAYSAYLNLKNKSEITLLACMTHARRGFDKAKKNDLKRANKALDFFQELYAVERDAKENKLDFDATRELRQKEAKPILEKLKKWLDEQFPEVLPKNDIGKAISYTLNHWAKLERYVEQGRFVIDNNLIENTIRPVALGRKNYMFAGSHDAAQNAAMMYSFLGSCKLNNINPYEWLKHTLEALPTQKPNEYYRLLPNHKEN